MWWYLLIGVFIIFLFLAVIFGLGSIIRNFCYDVGIFKIYKVSRPVISIGNITTGGTGKTPMAIYLTEMAKERGFKPGIVSRGYGRNSSGQVVVHDGSRILSNARESGDESFLMAKRLQSVPVIVDADRVRGCEKIINEFDVDLLILDDAFQHRRIHRDMDIVLINASENSSAYFILPLGRLREMTWGLKRADKIIITKGRSELMTPALKRYMKDEYFANTHFQLMKQIEGCYEQIDIPNEPLFAFCGIAHPQLFYKSLTDQGITLGGTLSFKDHEPYGEKAVDKIIQKSQEKGNQSLITTEKDSVKLPDSIYNTYTIYILTMKLSVEDPFIDEIFSVKGQ